MSIEARLLDGWYSRAGWCYLLLPFSLLFAALAGARRLYFVLHPPVPLAVPVIVVGNVTVGGTGKTPLTLWLVDRLRASGYHPGIVSRGYGGNAVEPCPVFADSDPGRVGDEPVLLARRAGCPVWVGRRRTECGSAMLEAHPDVDVIVSDDGLQHYALARDMEIVVLDGVRRFGNGLLLPAGPLREPRSRLARVDAVVVNGGSMPHVGVSPLYPMRLVGGRFYRLSAPDELSGPERFLGVPLHAVAAIGNPVRFFDTLRGLGLDFEPNAWPDHHVFSPGDLPDGPIVMTEKDAVKCSGFGRDDIWVFAVDAEVSEGLETQILNTLKAKHGQQTA